MAATAPFPAARSPQVAWRWLENFFVQELKPYPGRTWTVARMTIAATLMMWWIMTFRIPGAALGAYFTLLFSRDSARATVTSALTSVAAVACGLLFVLAGVAGLIDDPFLHFAWVSGTLFVSFFLISALSNYNAATAFGFLAITSITSWDFPGNTELLVEGTLWTALAVLTAAAVTVAVELVSQKLHPFDQFRDSLQERIITVEAVFRAWAAGSAADDEVRGKLEQYAMLGTALLRRMLARSNEASQQKVELSALVALIGRLVDLTASQSGENPAENHTDRERFGNAAAYLHQVHAAAGMGNMRAIPPFVQPPEDRTAPSLVGEVELTVARIPQIFSGLQLLSEFAPSPIDAPQRNPVFKPNAFSSLDHVRFALKGTLAAVLCYLIYNAVDWRLTTSVSTCLITALSTVGSSRQKQLLRVAGAVLGGFVLGIGSQAFILPHLGGIGGFTVLFVAVTLGSSWVATASPRVSYAGVQTAFAFYVTQLATFGPQTSLVVARNDVVGILFGLLMMWITFDRLWVKNAVAEVIDSFLGNMRAIANFDRNFTADDLRGAINRVRAQRDAVSASFDRVRNEADALIFEFGRNWRQKVTLRNRIRVWQPQLRTYFLLQIALLHHRLQFTDRALPDAAENNVETSARILELLADVEDRRNAERDLARVALNGLLASAPAGEREAEAGGPVALSQAMLQAARNLAGDVLAHAV